ncbi:MAG: hypothetical protein WDM90_16420 [Ferruginibacter sp.]
MGVSGSGKTTIGELLSQKNRHPFFLMPMIFILLANKEKMQAGEPLTDDDRKDWLLALNKPGNNPNAIERRYHCLFCIKRKI